MQNYLKDLPLYFYHSEDEDETLISCMKLAKSQEKKVNVNTRGKEGMEIRLDSISASLVRSSASTRRSLAEMLSHNEGEVQMWNNWKPFPENPLWTYVDFQIDRTGLWDNCFHCTHHSRLKSSCTDMDLPQSWVSSSAEMYHFIWMFVLAGKKQITNVIISQIYQSLESYQS